MRLRARGGRSPDSHPREPDGHLRAARHLDLVRRSFPQHGGMHSFQLPVDVGGHIHRFRDLLPQGRLAPALHSEKRAGKTGVVFPSAYLSRIFPV